MPLHQFPPTSRHDPTYSVVPSNAIWRDPARAGIVATPRKNEQDNRRRDLFFPQVPRDARRIGEFIDEHGDVVVKPLDGMGCTSVFRVRDGDPNRNVIVETVSQLGTRTVMAQRFIPQITEGDKRILLIGGEVVPYSLARIPKPGETRGNLAAGGRGVARPLSPRDREIGEALAAPLAAAGLLVVGIDVIGDYLTEVNVTSPTCFVEITEQSGFDVGGMFASALLRACASQ